MTRLIEYLRSIPARKLAVAWTIIILIMLSVPGQDIPDVSMAGLDKPVHATLFFVFTLLWNRVFRLTKTRNLVLAVCLAASFAVLSELYQGILPFDRTPDKFDVLANWIGTGFAAILILIRRRRAKP